MSDTYIPPPLWLPEGMDFLWQYLLRHQDRGTRSTADARSLGFVAHCLAGFRQSSAQVFQDLYVTYKLGNKGDGYFVEFGACDGIKCSNTFMLETDLGWRGILAEPLPAWQQSLHANRRARIDHRCVWRRSGEMLEILEVEKYPELTSIKSYAGNDNQSGDRPADGKTFLVESVSLTDLLVQHGAPEVIDYISIDVEGAELDALEGLDFQRFKPRVITVEHNHSDDKRNAIALLLESHGFVREFEHFSIFDDWYFHPRRVEAAASRA
jgi:FkbM family methyltransferase